MKVTRIIEIEGTEGWIKSVLASSFVRPDMPYTAPSQSGFVREIARIEGNIILKVEKSHEGNVEVQDNRP